MRNLTPSLDCQTQTRALLSIRPPFVASILSGEKKFEFRRHIFSRPVDIVVVYATAPIARVVAEFDVLSVVTAPLPQLWRQTRKFAGIAEDDFYEYFDGLDVGHAIVIGEVRHYRPTMRFTRAMGAKPPQSFIYLDDWRRLGRRECRKVEAASCRF